MVLYLLEKIITILITDYQQIVLPIILYTTKNTILFFSYLFVIILNKTLVKIYDLKVGNWLNFYIIYFYFYSFFY